MTDLPTSLLAGLPAILATALMAMAFAFGGRIHPLQSLVQDRRSLVSFGAGVAAAYLFIGMMPELAEGMVKLDEAAGDGAGILVFVAALLGFLVFYGLDHSTRIVPAAGEDAATHSEARVYGNGLYIWLLTYVMVLEADGAAIATLWYALAMSFHFLAIDHSLREKRGEVYDRQGRYLLAFCTVLGWIAAQVVELSDVTTALALGFVSGALTVNSAIMELSEGVGGRFLPFALGCLFFAAVLLGVGTLS